MKKVGKYLLQSKLGQGQFGVVYKASHQETEEIFAVKSIEKSKVNSNQKLRKLFETEMSIMTKIDHPNILHLYEYLETANNYYLVITYCNGGDLEEHVKKNSSLGEEEATYFLMQIMNGFKELHRHKIMHRDFKLANIFLHDDQVVIGDFGFAKSGADMTTTKLGSPITMAPELLNAGATCKYTNKADLWSIGVCFYHMIYGKPPWDAKSMADLQSKVKTMSGDRLVFPASPKISDKCKELLKALLQPDPQRRIEWSAFFNHKVFAEIGQQNQPAPVQDMKQSVMFHGNKDKVLKQFNDNKTRNDPNEIELEAEPENIKVQVVQRETPDQIQQQLERAISQGKMRFTHEKKVIVFLMHTCRKLRNLAKRGAELGKAANGFMFTAILLMRKGIIMNETCLRVIRDKQDYFNLGRYFPDFLNSPVCLKIFEEMSKDSGVYKNLQQHLQSKLAEEIPDDQNSREVARLSMSPTTTVEELQKQLKLQTYWLLDFFSTSKNKFNAELKKELMIGIVHLYLSTDCDVEFLYKGAEGEIFDWTLFEKKMNMQFVESTMLTAMTKFKVPVHP